MAKKAKETNRVIYIGPNLPKGKLTTFTVFSDGLPTHLTDVFSKYPEITHLFIKTSELTEKIKQRDTKGTPLNIFYTTIKEGRK